MGEDIEREYYLPDPCPECGSDKTYWSNIFNFAYRCLNCGLVVDSAWLIANEPTIILGENAPRP